MSVRQWIKAAQSAGWTVASVKGQRINLRCSCTGCPGALTRDLDALGPDPEPCSLPHKHGHGAKAFEGYEELVEELRRRRRSLGLDQNDLADAMGMADGYVNKLESFARIPPPATLTIWAEALGLRLTTTPAPLPPSTVKAIDERRARPYQHSAARFKHERQK